MGTTWWIRCDDAPLAGLAAPLVADVEATLSRFRADSALARLNRDRRVDDPRLVEVVVLALRLRDQTAGAFDPTLGRELVGWGYDRDFARLPRRSGVATARGAGLEVDVVGSQIRLNGAGDLDLGGIGKGWAADLVAATIRAAGARWVVVDAGGDLRVSGRATPLGAADGSVVTIADGGLATSSTRRRRWRRRDGGAAHHLLDPADGAPAASGVHTATVRAATAAEADAWAKALVIRPGLTGRLRERGGSAWIGTTDGAWWTLAEEAA